ncbi:MAG: T9SS type A sorting domain-containing protein [Flavobacteriales bacterium]
MDCLPPLPDGLETLYTNSQECLPNMPSGLTAGTVNWGPATSAPVCGPLDDCPPALLITNVGTAEEGVDILQVYPNPATDQLIVRLPRNTTASAVDVLDVVGRVVFTTMFSGTRAQVDVSALPAGMYHVRGAGQVAGFVKR